MHVKCKLSVKRLLILCTDPVLALSLSSQRKKCTFGVLENVWESGSGEGSQEREVPRGSRDIGVPGEGGPGRGGSRERGGGPGRGRGGVNGRRGGGEVGFGQRSPLRDPFVGLKICEVPLRDPFVGLKICEAHRFDLSTLRSPLPSKPLPQAPPSKGGGGERRRWV